jgi:hypothetical protein
MPSQRAHQQWSSTVSNRWILALALIAVAPAVAAAQFTTFIASPNPVRDSIKAVVVAQQKSTADSITHAQITDMKSWVDSAAGIAAVPAIDTVIGVRSTTQTTTAVSNGVVAPATASLLPFLLVIGGSAMLVGLVLLRRPQVKPRRADR